MFTKQEYDVQSSILKQYDNQRTPLIEVIDRLALEIEKLNIKTEALQYIVRNLEEGEE